MTLNGITFEDIDPTSFPSHNFNEYDEGKRTHIKSVWVDEFIHIDCDHTEYAAHRITLSNYGSATIDDKPIRDQKELQWVKKFFADLKLLKVR